MDKFLSENKVSEGIREKSETGVGGSVNPGVENQESKVIVKKRFMLSDVENQESKVIGKKRFMLSEYNDYVPDFSVYEPLRPSEAVRAMCKQCCVYNTHEARKCVSKSCPLWLLRKRYFKC